MCIRDSHEGLHQVWRVEEIGEGGKARDVVSGKVRSAVAHNIEKFKFSVLDMVLYILAGQPGVAGAGIVADQSFKRLVTALY